VRRTVGRVGCVLCRRRPSARGPCRWHPTLEGLLSRAPCPPVPRRAVNAIDPDRRPFHGAAGRRVGGRTCLTRSHEATEGKSRFSSCLCVSTIPANQRSSAFISGSRVVPRGPAGDGFTTETQRSQRRPRNRFPQGYPSPCPRCLGGSIPVYHKTPDLAPL
jgi:hypothetical protein